MFFLDTFAVGQTVTECTRYVAQYRPQIIAFVTAQKIKLHLLTWYTEQLFNIKTRQSTIRCNIVTQYYWPSRDTL